MLPLPIVSTTVDAIALNAVPAPLPTLKTCPTHSVRRRRGDESFGDFIDEHVVPDLVAVPVDGNCLVFHCEANKPIDHGILAVPHL